MERGVAQSVLLRLFLRPSTVPQFVTHFAACLQTTAIVFIGTFMVFRTGGYGEIIGILYHEPRVTTTQLSSHMHLAHETDTARTGWF